MTMETLLRGYGCFWWILCLCVVVQASDWTSWFSSSSSDDKAEVTNNTTPQVLPSGLLVSPIVNREISVGIQAPWETPKNILSALLCEAFALEGERILNALVERPTPKHHLVSEAEARKIVLDLLPNEESSSKVVLEWSLQLRSASPHCRSFQTLLPEHAENTLHHAAADENLWIVLYPTQTMIAGSQILSALDDATTEPFRWDFLAKGKATVDHLSDDQQQQIFLPNEPIFGNGPTNGPLIALYADLASPEFVKVYQSLKASSSSIRFVVRSYAHHNDTTHLTLRGYGVRLDIRNVEYKVFDDDRRYSTSSSNNTNDSGFMTLDDAIHLHPLAPQFLAGVNLTHIKSDNVSLKKHLWKQHDREPIVPPKWQRRKLSLQAATAIANSSDPLYTLERIVQDLPSTASTLVLMNVDDKIVQYTSQLDETLTRSTVLYINGKLVSAMDRPSFNIFELLDALRMAQVAMRQWRQDLEGVVPNNAIPAIYELWRTNEQDATVEAMDDQDSAMSKPSKQPLRIQLDKGWKKAIIFLNDVENDAQYSPWPTSVRQALMSVQYGMPPTIRRNLFTFVAVMDLEPNKGLDFAFQVAQSSYPIRIGVLLVTKAELEECALWLGANPDGDVCPTRRILPVGTTIQNVKAMPATTQAVHRLLSTFASDHEDEGLLISYLQYFITMMEDLGTSATISDLLDIHEKLLQGLRISREGRQIGFLALMDETSDYSYGKGLKFALEKGLNPGQSFLNGRPFVNEKTFAEEQTTIFTMIMKDEITDFTPRSVYRKLLSGDNVYPKLHPLLSDDEGSGRYQRIPGYLGTEKSILAANDATSNSSEAIFLFDAYLDYETEIGLKVAISLLSSLEEIGKKTENVVFVRIFASTDNAHSSPLCPLFMNASALKIPELKDVLSKILVADEMKGDEIINALNLNLHDECAHVTAPSRRAITANGRVYDKISSSIDVEDMELLMSLELERSKRVTKTLQPESSTPIQPKDGFHVAHVAALLALDSNTERRRWTMDSESPLDYSWNKPLDIASPFQVEVTAIVNPVSEGAQRVAPILRLIRDQLKLPLYVKLAPSLVLEDSDKVPITSYYRLVLDSNEAVFSNLPTSHVLTVKVDVPEPWNVQQAAAVQDTDNLRCDIHTGCGDYDEVDLRLPMYQRAHVTKVQYVLKNLLVFGQCYDRKGSPPNGLQLNLLKNHDSVSSDDNDGSVEVLLDGSIARSSPTTGSKPPMVIYSDTLVMKNVGYWQLRANPGMWKVEMASKGAEIFELVPSQAKSGRIVVDKDAIPSTSKSIAMTNFATTMELLVVQRRPGFENANLFEDNAVIGSTTDDDTIHVFSLATGHLYERFLKIMMLSVTKRTSAPVKFWLFENFLSPTFKASATAMAGRIGCSVEFVTYKWPEWLRGQREKQRIIWGYKILFLDVLFPLSVKKIIYVDADQVVRGDLKELWDMDLKGAPYGYTPFCQSRASTLGYQFWREGFWKNHLRGKPYHISALYVVDLERFRSGLVGDQLRSIYQQLSADPNSLANLDQDLPNYAQHQVPIFSLPQEWLWCESWCSDDTKATAKTIDLCNNPEHKEPKVSMAKRIISGELFPESWMELDAEVERYEQDYYQGLNHTVDGEFATSYY